jgi:hypothetical protein
VGQSNIRQTPTDYNATAKPSKISSELESLITIDEKKDSFRRKREPTDTIRGNPGLTKPHLV